MQIEKKLVIQKDKENIFEYTLKNDNGMEVKILTLGGIITSILTENKNGIFENVVVGWKDYKDYINDESYAGAIVGRFAGRIADGRFILNGREYILTKNNNGNTLHGGINGLTSKIWDSETRENDECVALILTCFSNNGEEGFPGNLKVKVIYSLNNNNELELCYEGKSDQDTILNLTNHSYFNLSGDIKANILKHDLIIKSDKVASILECSALSGELFSVDDTPHDFRKAKNIGKDIDKSHKQIILAKGYDNPWILEKNYVDYNIKLSDKISGRYMKVITDREAVVIYTTNYPADKIMQNGYNVKERDAICFETQNLPIAKNNIFTKNSILLKNDIYKTKTIFKFGVNK